jgi:hypothetical protein
MGRGEGGARSRLRRVRRLGALGIFWAIAQACNVDSGPSRCLNPQPLPPYCGNGGAPGPGAEDSGPTANVGESDAAASSDASAGGGFSGEGGIVINPSPDGSADSGAVPPQASADAGSDGGGTASHEGDAGLDAAPGDAATGADAQGATDASTPDAGHD